LPHAAAGDRPAGQPGVGLIPFRPNNFHPLYNFEQFRPKTADVIYLGTMVINLGL
jgi:hypothetical protein